MTDPTILRSRDEFLRITSEQVRDAVQRLTYGLTTPGQVAAQLLNFGYRGRIGEGCVCPLSLYLDKHITTGWIYVQPAWIIVHGQGLRPERFSMPPLLMRFVIEFDGGLFPALVDPTRNTEHAVSA